VDLELGDRELFKRHHLILEKEDPLIEENLFYLHERIENPLMIGFPLLDMIEIAVNEHNAKLVIIDNISKLLPDSLKHDSVALVIAFLDRIRQKTGASILVVGHTTKGNPATAIQSVDFFGSSMLQNFFKELTFLDKTKDGRFFLCQSKSKLKDPYDVTVPVFTRGDHPVLGVGFNYEALMPLAEIQLPYVLTPHPAVKKRNINNYRKEIAVLDHAGISKARIAEIFGVSRGTVYQVFDE